jgi:hypothetical protein
MFTVRRNVIVSDEGFSIAIERDHILYFTPAGCEAKVRHEILPSPITIGVWNDVPLTGDGGDLTPRMGNVIRALEAAGFDVVVLHWTPQSP